MRVAGEASARFAAGHACSVRPTRHGQTRADRAFSGMPQRARRIAHAGIRSNR
ncbi:hypothetical protein BDSB_01385 [Burkholderia dolosa PC543]|nr:hypothetical protein BDSB_01385 [Burkholderia dolosa PC543]